MLRKTKTNTRTLRPWQEKVSQKVAGAINKVQNSWASWMNGAVNRLSPKGKKVAILCFCVFMGAASALSIVDGTVMRKPKIDARIDLPKSILALPEPAAVLPEATAGRIKQFLAYLDSLGKSEGGINRRDSLLKSRPGLLDSLEQIEKYYQLQLNNH